MRSKPDWTRNRVTTTALAYRCLDLPKLAALFLFLAAALDRSPALEPQAAYENALAEAGAALSRGDLEGSLRYIRQAKILRNQRSESAVQAARAALARQDLDEAI